MRYYPLCLDVKDRNCLVVGGGGVGTRKVETLLDCGALVTVVSLEFSARLEALAAKGRVRLERRVYRSEDLEGKFLVIGATDEQALNRRISRDAEARNLLCNIADQPALCNFILPAVIDRGDLVITASTSGKSPAFAKTLRRQLEQQFGEEYAPFLKLMGKIREVLLAEAHEPEAHRHLFEALIQGGLLDMLRQARMDDVRHLLASVLGKRVDPEDLLAGIAPGRRGEGG
jgi:precorrin-2 dehydrogenase/sirohydrochlorin ferrochelatase